jgi:flagellar L-ring protein FlgH
MQSRDLCRRSTTILVTGLALAACQSTEPIREQPAALPESAPRVNRSFVADRKAERIGDLVTVFISETASVNARSRTSANKEEGAGVRFESLPSNQRNISGELQRQFDGGGQVERSGRLLARLATTVVEADGSGRLRIRGEQLIVINDEKQVLRLEGYVRAEDIGPDNAISSQRVALARIELSGQGVLGKSQAPGWLTRLFMWAGE